MTSSYPGKRAFDLMTAGAACAVLAPLATTIAVATVLEDGGRALFVQSRTGYLRQPFDILKFRTMQAGKVTRIGRLLRQTGLDELPQFVNVIRGEMSVVGPRPLTPEDVHRLGWDTPEHAWRFAAKPGITGLSQLMAGSGARASRRLEQLYLRKQGPILDAKLVAITVAVHLIGKRRLRRILSSPRVAVGGAAGQRP